MDSEICLNHWMTLENFSLHLEKCCFLELSGELTSHLYEVRNFIDHLCSQDFKLYGITTGFGSLRNKKISSEQASLLSKNLILSHDAGIGRPLPKEVTLGAMILRAYSLGKGYSGFSPESLNILVSMINNRIIPEIPSSGSLGASGDLAFLARLGHAMMGGDVIVDYQGSKIKASEALKLCKIEKFNPKTKEGLALINGTSFMASMLAIAYLKQEKALDNLIGSIGVFINAVGATKAAFSNPIQSVRKQFGQTLFAQLVQPFFLDTDFDSSEEIQNDYCIRCLPQIFGPRIEHILDQKIKIERELNAVTDNPLIFKNIQATPDMDFSSIYSFKGENWAVISGGNFHGENLTTYSDCIAIANAKMALTIERQIAYMLNPWRNSNHLPDYLISTTEDIGLKSGFMIPHYTANAIVHKICLLAQPSSLMNCTSANETEDVVSYGATACHKLLEQINLLEELITIHLLTSIQAYSISRKKYKSKNKVVEEIFCAVNEKIAFPINKDEAFQKKYEIISDFINSGQLREIINFPFSSILSDGSATRKNALVLENEFQFVK